MPVSPALVRGQPAISVDTKKKELVGDFKNGGREWHPQGKPEEVRVHDFPDKTLGKAIPYGVYDMLNDQGWVSVGIDHDTAQFATNSIRRWWHEMGSTRFPKATELLITADGGGSNGHRTRLWKVSLQGLADDLGLKLSVSHFPPGTSKWNKIEHRLFSFITQNWRGQPLVSHQTIVNLIAGTTTKTGLIVKAALDTNEYATEIKVSDEELAASVSNGMSFMAIGTTPSRHARSGLAPRNCKGDFCASPEGVPGRRVGAMMADLAGSSPSPLESLLVDRIGACWLQLSYADATAAQAGEMSIQQGNYLRKRQDSAHRRYLTAVGALAMTRRLLGSAVDSAGSESKKLIYVRIAGPHVWIELPRQRGIHCRTIWRDRERTAVPNSVLIHRRPFYFRQQYPISCCWVEREVRKPDREPRGQMPWPDRHHTVPEGGFLMDSGRAQDFDQELLDLYDDYGALPAESSRFRPPGGGLP